MKKTLVILIILLVGASFSAFAFRTQISDWFYQKSTEPLPEAVSFNELKDEISRVNDEAKEIEEPEKILDLNEPEITEPSPEVEDDQVLKLDDIVEGAQVPDEPIKESDLPPVVEEDSVSEENSDLPSTINLAVPFTSQAPYANWSLPYQETCEEASVLMVDMYYNGVSEGKIDAKAADDAILKLVEFQQSVFGYYEDTDVLQTSIFTEQYYGYNHIEIIDNPTVEVIKSHLAEGRPVIVPAAGQMLGNPYFSGDGPPYHMLVIRGYTETSFITNDPGTRRGEGFTYTYSALMNAIHDWTGNKDTIRQGKKVVMVIYP